MKGSGNRDLAFFDRLPQKALQAAAMEFRQFVEKQNAVMGHTDFAWRRRRAAADHARVADRVMRRAKRPRRHQQLRPLAAGPAAL